MNEKMEVARELAMGDLRSRLTEPLRADERIIYRGGFADGYTAGYSAANEWVRIDGPDDLPKEEGFYLWQYRSNGGHNVQYIHDTTPEYYVAEYAAWRKVEPYQSKGEGMCKCGHRQAWHEGHSGKRIGRCIDSPCACDAFIEI